MKIKELRKNTGLTQAAFAEKYHIPIKTIQKWEREERRCPSYVAEMLERCIYESLFVLPVTGEPLRTIRDAAGMTAADVSSKYHIPLITIKQWETGSRQCPPYVADMLERCIRCDKLPVYYCMVFNATGSTIFKSHGWYFTHAQACYYCTPEFMTIELGYPSLHKCELEANKTRRKLIRMCDGIDDRRYVVARAEQVPLYAPDFAEFLPPGKK